ncbi:DedA family protein [Tabrizicola sp. BL-A-41-H6]|uniref:DedA family protein n=1 Tax=Tabrizicola sp. BL-A-41-H6 TaxID=3421107 RepID=UPI003D6755BA
MDALIETTLAFVRENAAWAFWISLVFAIGENLALISIVIPSTAILLGVGALVATGQVDFLPIWAGATIGAIIGSFISYAIGWVYGDTLLSFRPVAKHADLIEKGNAAFRRWGALAVLIGHFFGPLRAVVFLMAGIARLNLPVFIVINVVGCALWAYVTPKFGEVAGYVFGWIWRALGF